MKRNKTDNTVLLNKLSTANWECFRTPLLPEIWKILNPLEVMFVAFLDQKHLFHFLGCARNTWLCLAAGRWCEDGQFSRERPQCD